MAAYVDSITIEKDPTGSSGPQFLAGADRIILRVNGMRGSQAQTQAYTLYNINVWASPSQFGTWDRIIPISNSPTGWAQNTDNEHVKTDFTNTGQPYNGKTSGTILLKAPFPAGNVLIRVGGDIGAQGWSSIWEGNVNYVAYTAPKITSTAAVRCNAQGAADPFGTYIKASAAWTNAVLSGTTNAVAASFQWGEEGGALSAAISLTGQNIFSAPVGGNLSVLKTYTVRITASDTVTGANVISNQTIAGATPSLYIRKNGRGIGLGKSPTQDYVAEAAWPIKLNNGMTISTHYPSNPAANPSGVPALGFRNTSGELIAMLVNNGNFVIKGRFVSTNTSIEYGDISYYA